MSQTTKLFQKKTKYTDAKSLLSEVSCEKEVLILESDNPIETVSDQSANYDLLILGTPEKDNWLNVLFGVEETSLCKIPLALF